MSSLIKKHLFVYDKKWKSIVLLAITAVIIVFSLFCIVSALIGFTNIIKIPVIILSLSAIAITGIIYLLLCKKAKKVLIVILAVILSLVLAISGSISILVMSGKSSLLKNNGIHIIPPDIEAVMDDNGIITYNNQKYIYNNNLTTILFMGIDKSDISSTGKNGNNGQADAVYAVTIDTVTGKTTVLCISRETMTDIQIYSGEGNYIRTEQAQLCLSYAYGDGKEKSCENCVWSASNILCGVPINTYMAIDFSAIAVLNDAVGGVEVPEYNSSWTKQTGKTTILHGQDAYEYVHYRDITKIDSNAYRITRQIDYLKAFSAKAIEKTKKDITTPLNLYNKINKYSVNNLSADRITYLTSVFLSGSTEIEFRNIEGEIKDVGEHAGFYPDSEKLYELVLDIFYKEV